MTKDWELENNTNLNSILCFIKSSQNYFIFSPAFYLIMWLMTSPKNFEILVIFENMRAFFLLRCQNSLWQTSPKIMHFQR